MSDYILQSFSDGYLKLILNRPKALNAFLPEMLTELAEIMSTAKSKGIKVITLEGQGRAFSAGVDLKALRGVAPKAGQIDTVFDGPGVAASTALRNAGIPVIAKVHGACFTGALELALCCDFIFATQDTKFGDTHAKFGLRPTWGLSQTLSAAVGIRKAKELSYTARTFTGAEAAGWGLLNDVVATKDALDDLVQTRVDQILSCVSGSVNAYVDLYDYASEPTGREEGIKGAYDFSFPNIDDAETARRLSKFM